MIVLRDKSLKQDYPTTLSMAKLKSSLGNCHTALENMWVIFKYLWILISNIIPQ